METLNGYSLTEFVFSWPRLTVIILWSQENKLRDLKITNDLSRDHELIKVVISWSQENKRDLKIMD